LPSYVRQALEILELEEERPRLTKELSWYNDKIVNYLIEILCPPLADETNDKLQKPEKKSNDS